MTNWDYYEAANRFQKVLEAAGTFCVARCLLLLVSVFLPAAAACCMPLCMLWCTGTCGVLRVKL